VSAITAHGFLVDKRVRAITFIAPGLFFESRKTRTRIYVTYLGFFQDPGMMSLEKSYGVEIFLDEVH